MNTFAILNGPKIFTKTMHKVLIRSMTEIHYKPKSIFFSLNHSSENNLSLIIKANNKNKGQVNFLKKTIKIYATLSL